MGEGVQGGKSRLKSDTGRRKKGTKKEKCFKINNIPFFINRVRKRENMAGRTQSNS